MWLNKKVKHKVATFLLVCEIVTETEKKGQHLLISAVPVGQFALVPFELLALASMGSASFHRERACAGPILAFNGAAHHVCDDRELSASHGALWLRNSLLPLGVILVSLMSARAVGRSARALWLRQGAIAF